MVLDEAFDIATRAGLHCVPQAHRVAETIEIGALYLPGHENCLQISLRTLVVDKTEKARSRAGLEEKIPCFRPQSGERLGFEWRG